MIRANCPRSISIDLERGGFNLNPNAPRKFWLPCLGLLLCLCYAAIYAYSSPFQYESEQTRPIVTIVILYGVASTLSLASLAVAIKSNIDRTQLLYLIAAFGISFRLIQLFTTPILEIDYYRYMWDGMVVNEGVSPYRFAPDEVIWSQETGDVELSKLKSFVADHETAQLICERIHFEEHTTIYPPISQAVFAVCMWVVPDQSSWFIHLLAMKFTLVLFDLGTVWLVGRLIMKTKQHVGWLLAYAWNPLVIKEIANSGHLDSIAVFFVVASVWALSKIWRATDSERPVRNTYAVSFAAVLLAAGVGAKLFPVILFPLFLIAVVRKGNWKTGVVFSLVFGSLSFLFLLPMIQGNRLTRAKSLNSQSIEDSKEGLSSFLTQWRMNDLVFSVVYENLKKDDRLQDEASEINQPWYVVVPKSTVVRWHRKAKELGIGGNVSFTLTRLLTTAMFLLAYLGIAIAFWRSPDCRTFLAFMFLVLATFFMLQPTQNPWYWVWAMPFVCFSRNRGWLTASMFLILYYLRFHYETGIHETRFAGILYTNAGIFDYIIVFIEYGLIVIAITTGWIWKMRQTRLPR